MGGGGGRKPKPRLLGQARPEHHYLKLLPTSLYVIVTASDLYNMVCKSINTSGNFLSIQQRKVSIYIQGVLLNPYDSIDPSMSALPFQLSKPVQQ
jgi:hypothetical protein